MKNPIKKLTKEQVVGLTDAEGSFFAKAYEREGNSGANTYDVVIEFKISQSDYSEALLLALKDFFNCGKVVVDNWKEGSSKLKITQEEDILGVIIPFFDANPLVSSKQLDYLAFKQFVQVYWGRSGTMNNALYCQLEKITAESNNSRSSKEVWEFSQKHSTVEKITPGWLAGFIEGDGSFQINMAEDKNKKRSFYASLEIAQSCWRRPLLLAIQQKLGSGSMSPSIDPTYEAVEESSKKHKYASKAIDQHIAKLIPMLDGFTFTTIKGEDYADWKRLITMYKAKKHLQDSGWAQMSKIKKGMNAGRPARIKHAEMVKTRKGKEE